MKQDEIIIRKYTDGDELGVLKLLQDIFHQTRTMAYWNWLFRDNKCGKGWIIVGEKEHQILAHQAIMRADLNFMGRRILGGQSLLTMVHSDLRKNNLFLRIVNYCYEYAAAEGLCVVFGVPNRNSYPGLMRHLGWHKVVDLSHFVRRIGYRKIWGTATDQLFKHSYGFCLKLKMALRKILNKNSVVIVVSTSLTDDIEDMLREIRNYQVLAVWKDIDYLRWRYENDPDGSYLFHIAKIADQTQAILVTKIVSKGSYNTIAICELLHRNNDKMPSQLLINHVVNYYMQSNAQYIEFYGHDAGYFNYIFDSCGFKIDPISGLVFGCRVFSHPDLDKMSVLPHNWTIVIGDTDQI
jgi:hypothetical protein